MVVVKEEGDERVRRSRCEEGVPVGGGEETSRVRLERGRRSSGSEVAARVRGEEGAGAVEVGRVRVRFLALVVVVVVRGVPEVEGEDAAIARGALALTGVPVGA